MKTSRIVLIVLLAAGILIIKVILTYSSKQNSEALPIKSDQVIETTIAPVKEKSVSPETHPEIETYSINHLNIEKPKDEHRYDNVQLYPIYASTAFLTHHKNLGPYYSLEEALAKAKVHINEVGENSIDGEVNTLFIENISADTIIILGGEVVRGGKQDRMIAKDFMLYPHSGKIDISVYCVEHNRWTPKTEQADFEVTIGLAPANVRGASREKLAQQSVWDEVDVLHESYRTEEDTKALAYATENPAMMEDLEPYLEKLQDIQWSNHVIGVIAVMDKQIVGCDFFAQHNLFKKYYPALLKSYVGNLHEATYEPVLSNTEVQSFFNSILQNEKALNAKLNDRGTQLIHNSFRIHGAIYP